MLHLSEMSIRFCLGHIFTADKLFFAMWLIKTVLKMVSYRVYIVAMQSSKLIWALLILP